MEKELTKFELKLMNILWDKGHAFVNDIIEALPEPKLANSTISTTMRKLVTKGFVGYESFNKSNRYYPQVSKEKYTQLFMSRAKDNFFGGSALSMLSFFTKKAKLSEEDINELIDILNEIKK